MPRPRKAPLGDSGADLLEAVNAGPPAAGAPTAEPAAPVKSAAKKPVPAKSRPAKSADAAAGAEPAPKARTSTRKTTARAVADAGLSEPLGAAETADRAPAPAKPPKAAKARRKAGADEPMLDLGMAEEVPAKAASGRATVAAAESAPKAVAAPVAESASKAQVAPAAESLPAAPAPAKAEPQGLATEPRYPRRQPLADPPPRRPAPAPVERPLPVPRAAPLPPRPLSMAELADRQRQTREMARHPEREIPPGREAPQRPAPVSMQERAMRYRGAAEPESRAVAAAPAKDIAAPVAAQPERRTHEDSQARALEAARHKREPGPAGAASCAPPWETAMASGGATVALVTRNHAGILEEKLKAWRAALPEPDLRWAVLDLGSTDATAQKVEEHPGVRLIVRPGGLVEPAATLQALLKGLPGDAVVLVDVEADPDSVVESLLRALKAGAALAVAPRKHPDFLAISRAQWDHGGQPDLAQLLTWAEVHGGLVRFGALAGQARPRSLVQRLCPDAQASRWDLRRLLPARVRNLLNRFGMLGGAGQG